MIKYFYNNIFFKIKLKKGFFHYKVLGITFRKKKNNKFPTIDIQDPNQSFDTRKTDTEIQNLVLNHIKSENIKLEKTTSNKRKIAFLATELYDTGGHTECLKNVIKVLKNDFKIGVFLSKINASKKLYSKKLSEIQSDADLLAGIEFKGMYFQNEAINLFKKIQQYEPSTLFVFMHMDDSLNTAVIALVKEYTDTKIFYFNHGSHYPALGFSMSDASLECMPSTQYITEQKRLFKKCIRVNLPYTFEMDKKKYTQEEINQKKRDIGVLENNLCTVSGGMQYKFFDIDGSSYFELIKNLLKDKANLQHIILSNLSDDRLKTIKTIFKEDVDLLDRLIILPLSKDYNTILKCADVFIDSFPVGSALTQIDVMRLKIPSVIKINRDNIKYSFHEYLPKKYKYQTESTTDMLLFIKELLENANIRKNIVEANYEFYKMNYEGNSVRDLYLRIINNHEKLIEKELPIGAYNA